MRGSMTEEKRVRRKGEKKSIRKKQAAVTLAAALAVSGFSAGEHFPGGRVYAGDDRQTLENEQAAEETQEEITEEEREKREEEKEGREEEKEERG